MQCRRGQRPYGSLNRALLLALSLCTRGVAACEEWYCDNDAHCTEAMLHVSCTHVLQGAINTQMVSPDAPAKPCRPARAVVALLQFARRDVKRRDDLVLGQERQGDWDGMAYEPYRGDLVSTSGHYSTVINDESVGANIFAGGTPLKGRPAAYYAFGGEFVTGEGHPGDENRDGSEHCAGRHHRRDNWRLVRARPFDNVHVAVDGRQPGCVVLSSRLYIPVNWAIYFTIVTTKNRTHAACGAGAARYAWQRNAQSNGESCTCLHDGVCPWYRHMSLSITNHTSHQSAATHLFSPESFFWRTAVLKWGSSRLSTIMVTLDI